MKNILYRRINIFLIFILLSCKKDNATPASLASFTIFNAINNGDPVKADFTGKEQVFDAIQAETAYGTSARFAIPAGQTVPVKVVSSANTGNLFFNRSFNFQPGDIYSLFLGGEPGSVDTILLKENISDLPDSTMAVQFVNCSPSGAVRIVSIFVDYYGVHTPQAEIPALNYKESTGFILYPAPGSLSSYKFEFRDPVTDALLTTASLDWNKHHTTIVITGYAGASPALGSSRLNYDRPQ